MERVFYFVHSKLEQEQKYLIRTYFIIGETLAITTTPSLAMDNLLIFEKEFSTKMGAEEFKEEYENFIQL